MKTLESIKTKVSFLISETDRGKRVSKASIRISKGSVSIGNDIVRELSLGTELRYGSLGRNDRGDLCLIFSNSKHENFRVLHSPTKKVNRMYLPIPKKDSSAIGVFQGEYILAGNKTYVSGFIVMPLEKIGD